MVKQWIVDGQGWSRRVDGALALALMQHVGRAGFAQALLTQVNRTAAFEHCTVYELEQEAGDGITCSVLDAASRHRAPTALKTSTLFARRFSQLDVNRRYIDGAAPRGGLFATYFLSRDLPHHDYRDACYARNGLLDRFSLVSVGQGGSALALNFYKGQAQGAASGCERDQLLWHAPLLVEAAARHAALLRPVPVRSGEDLLARVPAHAALTAREAQLCMLLMEGHTVHDAASRMGVRPTTAITLKKRAFARLGVRTREELLRRSAG